MLFNSERKLEQAL
jgi:Ca2+-binding EF-hand superfamily protein